MIVVLVLVPQVAAFSISAQIEPNEAVCDPLCGVPMKRMPLTLQRKSAQGGCISRRTLAFIIAYKCKQT
jgi:hypothetical protein